MLGAGGVIIDYRAARTATTDDELGVTRDEEGLVVRAGDVEHRLALAPWELAELLRVTHVVEDDGYLEVSIDPLSDGSRELGTTPELSVGGEVAPLGMALLQADVDFARFCGGAASPTNASLYAVAPTIHAMELLARDPSYRRLAHDLVAPPILRSQIKASVGTLAQAEPVAWATGVEVHYITPRGQVIDADGDLIDRKSVVQAKRPYRTLARAVDAPGSAGAAIRGEIPALARVETYAIALTALDVHCRHEPQTCDAWHADALAAATRSSARAPTIDDEEMDVYLAGIMGSAQANAWTNTRYDVVVAAPASQQALALLDELVYDTVTGRGDRELLDVLLAKPLATADPTKQLLLDFHRGLRLHDGSPLPDANALFRMMQRVDDVAPSPAEATATRELLAGSVLATPWLRDTPVSVLAEHTMTQCLQALDTTAELARSGPHARTADEWLAELGRLERCRSYVPAAGWVLLRIGASFHYATGASWAAQARDSGSDERLLRAIYDRLRILRAHERALILRGDELGWKQTRTMVASLTEAIRR